MHSGVWIALHILHLSLYIHNEKLWEKLLFFIVIMGPTQIFMKITTIYSDNSYDFVTFTTQIPVFTINCSV